MNQEIAARLIMGFLLLGETFTTDEANVLIVLETRIMPPEEAGIGGTNYSVSVFLRDGLIQVQKQTHAPFTETTYTVTPKGKELLK